jgi:hypothetical protein
MVPPGWQPPSPGGILEPPAWSCPPPTSTAGSKAREPSLWGWRVGGVIFAARHACSPTQLASACLCPVASSSTYSVPCSCPHQEWEDHLPILNTILSPASSCLGRWPMSSSTKTIKASIPPNTAFALHPQAPLQWKKRPPSGIPLGSFHQHSDSLHLTPWTLTECLSSHFPFLSVSF